MPPKLNPNQRRVSMAQGTKTRDGPATTLSKGNFKKVKDVADAMPIKRTNMSRTADIRRARDSYAHQIASERAEQERDMWDLRKKINDYRKENEKLLKNQRVKWGMTFDELEKAKYHQQQAKDQNDVLYRELENKKAECDRLQNVMDEVKSKISIAMLELNDLNRDRKLHQVHQTKLVETNRRADKLYKSNREFRAVLLRNKVDPNVDAITMRRLSSPSLVPPLRSQRNTYREETTHQPQLITSKNLLSFRSMEDLRSKQKKGRTNLKRTKSLGQQFVTPRFFLTQYPRQMFQNVEVNV